MDTISAPAPALPGKTAPAGSFPPPNPRQPRLIAAVGRLLLANGALVLAAGGAAGAVAIGDYAGARATLLAIDDTSLPLKQNLCYYISKPAVRAKPVLLPSRDNPHATDTVGACFYGTVLQDGGKFRMWYYGLAWKKILGPEAKDIPDWFDNFQEGPICYAESADGLHWTKPNLGQVEHNGGRDNNAIALPDTMTEGAFIIKDEADPEASRRYKMVYENTLGPTARKAISSDGIHWTAAGDTLIEKGLELSSFYRFGGLYYIGAHKPSLPSEGGHRGGRQGYAWVSTDFDHWQPQAGESFLLPEPANPSDRGGDRPYVQVHLGVGAAVFGNVLVGLYCPWHARPNPGDWFGEGTTYGDLGLLVSNDGQHFREPVKGCVFLNRHDSPVSDAMVPPDVRYEEILTQSGNGILNVGDKTLIYHGRWVNSEHAKDNYNEIALASLPRDRWGALGLFPRSSEGSVWTAPLRLGGPGGRVTLNAQGARGMRVEIADERFGLLPEYSGENAGVVTADDGLDCAVVWPKGNLDSLVEKKVRLLIRLKRGDYSEPRLFAAYLSQE